MTEGRNYTPAEAVEFMTENKNMMMVSNDACHYVFMRGGKTIYSQIDLLSVIDDFTAGDFLLYFSDHTFTVFGRVTSHAVLIATPPTAPPITYTPSGAIACMVNTDCTMVFDGHEVFMRGNLIFVRNTDYENNVKAYRAGEFLSDYCDHTFTEKEKEKE